MNPAHCVSPGGLIFYLFNTMGTNSHCTEIYLSMVQATDLSFWGYLPFLLGTILFEAPIYYFGLTELSRKQRLLAILILNLATHPIIFFVFPLVLERYQATYSVYLTSAEIFAPVVETLILWKGFHVNVKRAFWISITANLISWWLGVFFI